MHKAIRNTLAAMLLSSGSVAMAEEFLLDREGLDGPLSGTLAGPVEKGRPGVLIVPGSGPTDRDGNNPLGVNAASYRLLAEALSQAGIPSLRTDKRGMFASTAAMANPNEVTIEDYAGDTLAWASLLRDRTGAGCAWLAGHSEGGIVALKAASVQPERLCGVILLASPGRPIGEALKEQLAAMPGAAPLMGEVERHIATLSAGNAIEEPIHPGLAALFGPQIQTFMASLLSQDPAAMAGGIDLPILILHGREDLQIADADADALAAAQENATLVMLDGVNHVLKAAPAGDRAANQAIYGDAEAPLAPGVAEAVVAFIEANAPG